LRERAPSAELDADGIEIEGPEQSALARLDLEAAIASLGPRDRELVALRYGADLTARQIGELLGEKTNAVEVALHRALRKLREALLDDPPPAPSQRAIGLASTPTA
jgi:RNA polymerase sigma-70 factor (ECF subfamily)